MTGVETGASYVFKVCAANASGKGRASDVSEAVCVKALPGNFAFLSFKSRFTHYSFRVFFFFLTLKFIIRSWCVLVLEIYFVRPVRLFLRYEGDRLWCGWGDWRYLLVLRGLRDIWALQVCLVQVLQRNRRIQESHRLSCRKNVRCATHLNYIKHPGLTGVRTNRVTVLPAAPSWRLSTLRRTTWVSTQWLWRIQKECPLVTASRRRVCDGGPIEDLVFPHFRFV